MVKTDVIIGTPVYTYRGTRYLEPIGKLVEGTMRYDEVTNTTYVKLIKKTYKIEVLVLVLMTIIMLAIMYINKANDTGFSFNSTVHYYDNILYLNWYNLENSEFPVTVDLYNNDKVIYSKVLEPGDFCTTIEVEDLVPSNTSIKVTSRIFGFNKSARANIIVDTAFQEVNDD